MGNPAATVREKARELNLTILDVMDAGVRAEIETVEAFTTQLVGVIPWGPVGRAQAQKEALRERAWELNLAILAAVEAGMTVDVEAVAVFATEVVSVATRTPSRPGRASANPGRAKQGGLWA